MAEVVYLLPRWTQQTWMANAACKGDTALFFAPFGEQADAREARESIARQICESCSVITTCRDFARRNREYGFWGGENDEQRDEARRRTRGGRPRQPATGGDERFGAPAIAGG